MLKIIEKEQCCGCSACAQVCPRNSISMQEDSEGFLYPFVNSSSCSKCGLCVNVCPNLGVGEEREPLSLYAAKNKNENVRLGSSSGGVFAKLAETVLLDQGVVFGAKFNSSWEVVHDYAETNCESLAFSGSKYVQSVIGGSYIQAKNFLEKNRRVLFSGTPCQTAGLKRFLGKDYEKFLSIDFVCHGVPSPKAWRFYLTELLRANKNGSLSNYALEGLSKITGISFRSKITGWKQFSLVITKRGIRESHDDVLLSERFSKNIYMQGFLKDLYLRPSCYKCAYKSFKSGSDVTIADYWGIGGVMPAYDDDKGVSLVFLNSPKGLNAYKSLDLESIETSFSDALAGNPVIVESVARPPVRDKFFDELGNRPFSEIVNELSYVPLLKRIEACLKNYVKRFVTIARRYR